ncbi:MAG TPA: aminopeptidase P N-terminal domain-containing protein, partial [Erysipelotrichaceae bacterium]|nr:aminopeptidase P N-terminal domain-containing protein [Erysipelotrichaceae bacterium]
MNIQAKINRDDVRNDLKEDGVLIVFSGNIIKSSADAEYPFVVNRNFYHLSQINEPNLMLIISKEKDILFIEESDKHFEKWIGKKISKEDAKEKSNVDDIRYLKDFDIKILGKYKHIYLDLEKDQLNDYPTLAQKFKEEYNLNAIDGYNIIAKSRSIKSKKEVAKVSEAIEITKVGLNNIMKSLEPNKKEAYFEAHFDFVLKSENVIHAFDTIAASGNNATTLHYVTNDEVALDNELILFDLGATSDLYCADISRTYPISGKFSKRQKELY